MEKEESEEIKPELDVSNGSVGEPTETPTEEGEVEIRVNRCAYEFPSFREWIPWASLIGIGLAMLFSAWLIARQPTLAEKIMDAAVEAAKNNQGSLDGKHCPKNFHGILVDKAMKNHTTSNAPQCTFPYRTKLQFLADCLALLWIPAVFEGVKHLCDVFKLDRFWFRYITGYPLGLSLIAVVVEVHRHWSTVILAESLPGGSVVGGIQPGNSMRDFIYLQGLAFIMYLVPEWCKSAYGWWKEECSKPLGVSGTCLDDNRYPEKVIADEDLPPKQDRRK